MLQVKIICVWIVCGDIEMEIGEDRSIFDLNCINTVNR